MKLHVTLFILYQTLISAIFTQNKKILHSIDNIKNMNSSFFAISILVKSNIGEKCLARFLMQVLNQGLRDYLKLANIYKGDPIKKKTDLIEMITYGCLTNELNKEEINDISTKHLNQLLKKKKH